MYIPERLKTLQYWIDERESIRKKKESGESQPWTRDKILQEYRFCNVRREDDRVSRWIYDNWLLPYNGAENMVLAVAMARMINWPPTLEDLGFPVKWDPERFCRVIASRMSHGKKVWTGAYMITAERDGTPKHKSVAKTLDHIYSMRNPLRTAESLLRTWNLYQTAPRVGSFIAAQFVGDLKRTDVLQNATDWWNFCAPGPGSTAGMNWLLGNNKSWGQCGFEQQVADLRRYLVCTPPLDAQNVQNCLCEVNKYQRGYSRTRYIPWK